MKLPPEISVEKRRLPEGGWAYGFRHRTLGELGRIVARDRPGGQCLISCEVIGDPADPMTGKRAEIFEPIGRAIAAEMEAQLGKGSEIASPPPPASADPGLLLENKLLQCLHCGAGVGRLVFAPQATDPARFEDHARMLYPTFTELDVPTWIIGPDLAGGPPETRPAEIMQVWPVRGQIRRLSPALFNPELDALQERHCRPDRAERRRRERAARKGRRAAR